MRLARKPKWRMRTKPLGSVCNRKRRRNSSSASGHQLVFVVVRGIAPAKRDLVIGQGDESVVGDGDAVGVLAEIIRAHARHLRRAVWSRRASRFGTGFWNQAEKTLG